MEVYCAGGRAQEAVTLLRFGPRTTCRAGAHYRTNKNSQVAAAAKKYDKFSFKFRRRSKSAPRGHTDRKQEEKQRQKELSCIKYSANGERLKNPDSPLKPDTVQLVGFTTSTDSTDSETNCGGSGYQSLDSSLNTHPYIHSRNSDIKTLSRTSKDIKMERERLRQEKLGAKGSNWSRDWYTDRKKSVDSEKSGYEPDAPDTNKLAGTRPMLSSNIAEERAKFFDDARERFHNANNDLFSKFLREREERFARLAEGVGGGGQQQQQPPVAFPTPLLSCGPNKASQLSSEPGADSDCQTLHSDRSSDILSEQSENRAHPSLSRSISREERIIPISVQKENSSDDKVVNLQVNRLEVTERIIPVMVESTSSEEDSSTDSNSSTPCQNSPTKIQTTTTIMEGGVPPPVLPPTLLSGNKVGPPTGNRTSFHHPSFANHFGFNRIGSGLKDVSDLKIFGDSLFPGFPNFGNFPSFTPGLLREGASNLPCSNLLREKEKSDFIQKQRLCKSKSSVDYSDEKPCDALRYVQEDVLDPYGDSETESESEDEDLESVSVVGDRARDRLSGTGSTHSTHSTGSNHSKDGSTHSHDSGIPEDDSGPRIRLKIRESNISSGSSGIGGTGRPRPVSAVPSEISTISDTSSLEDTDDKNLINNFSVNDRPLVINNKLHNDKKDVPIEVELPEQELNKKDADTQARLRKAFAIANELLKTEIHYVAILHLIDQVFHFRVDRENRSSHLFPQDTVTTIFSNIKSIYKFHAEFLLPQLQERLDKWSEGPKYQRIGDIMVKNAPFLKMYTEYVKNFDTAMTAINTHYAKSSKFCNLVDNIQAMPECENLSLQHHMLSPIQRIPRYEMLLKDYISKLPEDSPDRADAESALQQVSQAAAHANDSMKRIEQFKKLLEVQESIGGNVDLVSPTREVLKEGKIVKISARTGDHQDRYLFLLSDLLLLCSPRKSMISGPQFGLRARFEVDNMQVLEGDNLVTANTFYVRDDHKSVELYTNSKQEKEEWLECLFLAIKNLYTKKSSLRIGQEILRPLDSEIGKKQPHMQKVENVQKCTECAVQFSLIKHKHNCRFCGAVFCNKCTEYRHPLPWDDGKKARVCRACHQVLTSQNHTQQINQLPVRPKGLLEVPAKSSPAVQSGWLVLRPPGSKSSAQATKRYFLLLPDFVLYSFRGEEDSCALTATPVPGFTVSTGSQLKGDSGCADKDRDKVIKLAHPASKRTYYFAGTNVFEVERWADALQRASRAELAGGLGQNMGGSQGSSLSSLGKETGSINSLLREGGSDTQSTSSTEYENG